MVQDCYNNFNDLNLEEPTRYIPKEECHYLIDMDIGEHDSVHEDTKRWETIYSTEFLNKRTHPDFPGSFTYLIIPKAQQILQV